MKNVEKMLEIISYAFYITISRKNWNMKIYIFHWIYLRNNISYILWGNRFLVTNIQYELYILVKLYVENYIMRSFSLSLMILF